MAVQFSGEHCRNWIEILVHTSSYFIGKCFNGKFRFTIGGHHLKIELVMGSYMIIFLDGWQSNSGLILSSGRLGYGLSDLDLDLGFAPCGKKWICIQIDAVRPIHNPSKYRDYSWWRYLRDWERHLRVGWTAPVSALGTTWPSYEWVAHN